LSLLRLWNKGGAAAEDELRGSERFAIPRFARFFNDLVASAAIGESVSLLRPEGQSEPAPPEPDDVEDLSATSQSGVDREDGLEDELQAQGLRLTQPGSLVTTGSVYTMVGKSML
jgi:hypothetical protein